MLGLVTQTSVYHWSIEGKLVLFNLFHYHDAIVFQLIRLLFHGYVHIYGIGFLVKLTLFAINGLHCISLCR